MSIPKFQSGLMNIEPNEWEIIPVFEGQVFEKVGSVSKINAPIYRLNAEKLSKENCYIFYGRETETNYSFIESIRSRVFCSDTMKDKLKVECILLDNKYCLHICSFPKEFTQACIKTAKVFAIVCGERRQMTCTEYSKVTIMQFPAAENILWAELMKGAKKDGKASEK